MNETTQNALLRARTLLGRVVRYTSTRGANSYVGIVTHVELYPQWRLRVHRMTTYQIHPDNGRVVVTIAMGAAREEKSIWFDARNRTFEEMWEVA